MKKKISRRKFINHTGSAALAGTLLSQVGMKYAFAANTKPVSLLLGSHMDYLQALAPAYAEKYGVTPSIETVTTPDLSVKLNSAYIARKSVGDAIFVTASEIAGLADKGWLMDMSDFVNDTLKPNGVMEIMIMIYMVLLMLGQVLIVFGLLELYFKRMEEVS